MSALPAPPVLDAPWSGGYFFRRLFLTALAAALPVLGLFAWSLYSHVQQARDAGQAAVLGHSADAARRVAALLARLDAVADVLLAREEVAAMDGVRCGAALRDLPRVDPLILNVGLFDLDGRPLCLARTSAVMPPSFRDSPWFRQALASDARVLTAPYHSPASQRRVLSLASPVRDGAGRRIGVLGLSIDLERLSASLPGQQLPADAAVAVVGPDGTLIARSPDPERWIGTQAPSAALGQAPATAASGTYQARGVDGIDRLIGFAAVGRDGWRVYTGVPTEHYARLARDSSHRGLGGLLAALLLGVAASWLGARWLARPIQGLAATARRLAQGDESARADESQPGEVGQLGAEFNHMVRSLVESRNVERASTTRFLQLFNVIPVSAAVVDGAGRLVEVNDTFCRDHGTTRADALGRPLALLQPGIAQALAAHRPLRGVETAMPGPGGEERTLLLSVEPIDWVGRQAWLCVQVDVTEHRRSEALRAASAAKTEFLSRMSHELRTPLNAILGLVQLLSRSTGQRLEAAERHQMGLVLLAGEQLRALIDDVLDVARIESGSLPIAPAPLDLSRFADEALEFCEPAARDAGVRLHRPRAPVPAPRVMADATRLRQVLLNLLSNAIKYNRRGGEVTLQLAHDGDQVRLQVRDSGIGMSPAQLAGLFQPFNRLGREGGPVPGTGIGLVLTRHLLQLQGGALEVHSAEGRGTTVTMWLPRAEAGEKDDADTAPSVRAARAAEAQGEVLYIEDNPVNAFIVEQVLAVWPQVHLTVAPDGCTGLRLASERQPHVVLLDMQLPDLDGMEVLRRLREDPATRTIPVIVLSASAMPAEVAAARAAGADDFWAKPFDFDIFLDGLRARLPAVEV